MPLIVSLLLFALHAPAGAERLLRGAGAGVSSRDVVLEALKDAPALMYARLQAGLNASRHGARAMRWFVSVDIRSRARAQTFDTSLHMTTLTFRTLRVNVPDAISR